MSERLRLLLFDTRLSGDATHSGGVEAACVAGLISDVDSLRSFLYGRLRTAGVIEAHTAAAVSARALALPDSLWRGVEAELDARIPSPAARRASRLQGGHLFRLAAGIVRSPVLDALGHATIAYAQRPHHAVALGAIGAVAGVEPSEAAAAAAYTSIAGPTLAAQQLLGLEAGVISDLCTEMAPEIGRLAQEAGAAADRPLAALPAYGAPALEYLAEAHFELPRRTFAS